MPHLETAQSWLTQSTLLLQARPSTVCPLSRVLEPLSSEADSSQTRITTKYTIIPPSDPSAPPKKPRKVKPETTTSDPSSQTTQAPTQAPDAIRATLTLKTYDSIAGTTLKYTTTKAAEVSRLIQILGRLARPMAGLDEVKEDIVMGEAGGESVPTPVLESAKPVQSAGASGAGAGKKKKGKGKK